MTKTITELFYVCFPRIIRTLDATEYVLNLSDNHIITRYDGDKLIACAVINGKVVLLLCVHPDYRCRGIGSALLSECEEYVKSKGFDEIRFCNGPDYITPGVPMYDGNREYFEKRGYVHSWGDGECVDMMMELKDFHHSEYKLGDTVNGITYRRATICDREKVLECVADAADYFVEYYSSEELYSPDNNEFPLIALDGDTVCGALLVGSETEGEDLGSVGCTSTRHSHRGKGIATNMVKLGTRWLSEQGLKNGYLGYTYTDIIPMYAKSGYSVSMKYFMGVKKF